MLDFEEYTSPLSTVSLEDWSHLSKIQRKILTLRCSTFLPQELVAEKLGVELSEVITEENNALIALSKAEYRAYRSSKRPTKTEGPKTPRPQTLNATKHPCLRPVLEAKLGTEDLEKLMNHFQGVQLYIPRVPKETHKITLLLGPSRARCLSEHFGGYQINFPKKVGMDMEARNRIIQDGYYAGDRIKVIAERAGISVRRVHSILNDSGIKRVVPKVVHYYRTT